MEQRFYKDSFLVALLAGLLAAKLLLLAWILCKNPLGTALLNFPDSMGYIFPAQSLLEQGTFYDFIPRLPLTFRTPGYPLFLAIIYLLGGNNTWVSLVQILLSTLLLIPVYKTTFLLAGKTTARFAALLTALSILYTVYSYAVLAEILFVFLIAWFVYFFVRFLLKTAYKDLLFSTLFLISSIYVRPVAYYLPLGLFLLLIVFKYLFKFQLSIRKAALVLLLPAIVLLGAWNIRNKVQTGFGGFTSGTNYNIYFWNMDFVAHQNGITLSAASTLLMNKKPAGFEALSLTEQDQWYGREGRALSKKGLYFKIRKFPLWIGKTLLGNNFTHTSRLLTGFPPLSIESETYLLDNTRLVAVDYLKSTKAKFIFSMALLQIAGLLLLAAAGVFFTWKRKLMPRIPFYFLLCYTAYFLTLSSTFFGAHSRYRAPIELVFCIFGAVTLCKLLERCRGKN